MCFSSKEYSFCWLTMVSVKSKLLQDDLLAVCATFCVVAEAEGDGLLLWIYSVWCQEYDWCSNQCFYCRATHGFAVTPHSKPWLYYIASVWWAGTVWMIKYVTKVINIFSPSYHCLPFMKIHRTISIKRLFLEARVLLTLDSAGCCQVLSQRSQQ